VKLVPPIAYKPPRIYVCSECGVRSEVVERFRFKEEGTFCNQCHKSIFGYAHNSSKSEEQCTGCNRFFKVATSISKRKDFRHLCLGCSYKRKVDWQREYGREKYRKDHCLPPERYGRSGVIPKKRRRKKHATNVRAQRQVRDKRSTTVDAAA
jgi:hypothetical protein